MSVLQAASRNNGPQTSSAGRLIDAVEQLSRARDLESVMQVVKHAARELTGADGATFVLRDGDLCHYADEDAISPLWKGQRFPMRICISGWVMIHGQPAVIEDIYADPRIPADAYRPTFVKSLAMVPIRKDDPVGAIGNYWAKQVKPSAEDVFLLQALANATSVALENVRLYEQLQDKIAALEASNAELTRFTWVASHDLKSPLRAIDHLAKWIGDDIEKGMFEKTREHLLTLRQRVRRMEKLLDDVLEYARLDQKLDPNRKIEMVTGKELVQSVLELIDVPQGFTVRMDSGFENLSLPRTPLQQILCNLVNNAILHHDKTRGTVTLDVQEQDSLYLFKVTDDGPGIDPQYQQKIFEMFQTLKPRDAHEGSGMGLTLVKKILDLHKGDISVSSMPGQGAAFSFTWPKQPVAQG